jgi:hypothetical protein
MIMEPTSRDEIERSVVTREPTPSILAIRCHCKAAFWIRIPMRPKSESAVVCDY